MGWKQSAYLNCQYIYINLILRMYRILNSSRGVVIDDNFTWIQQIENTSINMSNSISILNKVCYIINRKATYSVRSATMYGVQPTILGWDILYVCWLPSCLSNIRFLHTILCLHTIPIAAKCSGKTEIAPDSLKKKKCFINFFYFFYSQIKLQNNSDFTIL